MLLIPTMASTASSHVALSDPDLRRRQSSETRQGSEFTGPGPGPEETIGNNSVLTNQNKDTGWWFWQSWKIWKSVGMIIPNIWEKKNVSNSNHQPEDNLPWFQHQRLELTFVLWYYHFDLHGITTRKFQHKIFGIVFFPADKTLCQKCQLPM